MAMRSVGRGIAALIVAGAFLAGSGPAAAAGGEGVDVGRNSVFTQLAPAEDVERMAGKEYRQQLVAAAQHHALAPPDHPQLRRLRGIAQRLIPQALPWNPRARDWQWEVNLIGSRQINAYCMPGGKIAFYTGILEQLHLSDDEVAMVMGHEMAHALREHARARMGKSAVTQGVARLGGAVMSAWLGIDPRLTDGMAQGGANLLVLSFSRSDESEADLVGMELAARAGFDPRAGVSLWRKMGAVNQGTPPQWLSTHPSGPTRIADIERNLPKVMPLYERAHAAASRPQ